MSNLFLLKSDHDREGIGDIIIDLDKVLRVFFFTHQNNFGICLCQEGEDSRAWFRDKNNFLICLKEIITRMGGDVTMADEIVLHDINYS